MSLQSLFDWLLALPPSTLLPALAILAAAENVFPPIPADALIALGGFLAARSDASPLPSFFAVLGGNVVGAMVMYAIGRRYGAAYAENRFHLRHAASADAKLSAWYAHYGMLALFLGRFIPGVRAIVAPFAGALRSSVFGTVVAISAASTVWYGLVLIVAFRAGNNWEQVLQTLTRLGAATGGIAAGLVALVVLVVWLRRRRRRG